MDANELLMGGGIKAAGFETMGDTVVGTICGEPKAQQMTKFGTNELDFWPSGDPKMQIVVPVQTEQRDPAQADDDGKRMLYITPRMMPAIRDAVKSAYAKGLAVGGQIAVRWTAGVGKTGDPRQWAAQYAPPALDPGSLLGNGNGNGHTAPAPTTAPVLAPAAPAVSPTLGSMLAGNGVAAIPPCPPGVDPTVWENLPPTQKQAILAAMSNPAASVAPF